MMVKCLVFTCISSVGFSEDQECACLSFLLTHQHKVVDPNRNFQTIRSI